GADARGAHWVRPEMVCEVEFFEWTRDGRMRHPTFVELREDKRAEDVVRERSKHVETVEAPPSKAKASSARKRKPTGRTQAKMPRGEEGKVVAGVAITHPDREVFPDVGVTKGELADYYDAVGPWMLPHVRGRPLSVVRCPQGQGKQCFYQKNWERGEAVGSHVSTIRLAAGTIDALVIDEAVGLV